MIIFVVILVSLQQIFAQANGISPNPVPSDPQIEELDNVQNLENVEELQRHHPCHCDFPPRRLPRNCHDVQRRIGNISGIYLIQPSTSPEPFLAVCDLQTREGGWTTLLNRYDGSQGFGWGWADFKIGFGNLATEFWLGLENLYHLTGQQVNELLVELEDVNGKKYFAHYSYFAIGSEKEGYRLKVIGGYNGDAGDSLKPTAGGKFSTNDRDQDTWANNCAAVYGGAWWHRSCMWALLTGPYSPGPQPAAKEHRIMYWGTLGLRNGLKKAKMMVRPRPRH